MPVFHVSFLSDVKLFILFFIIIYSGLICNGLHIQNGIDECGF
jgi:hypothetical protein